MRLHTTMLTAAKSLWATLLASVSAALLGNVSAYRDRYPGDHAGHEEVRGQWAVRSTMR